MVNGNGNGNGNLSAEELILDAKQYAEEVLQQIKNDSNLAEIQATDGKGNRTRITTGLLGTNARLSALDRSNLRNSNFLFGNLVEKLPEAMCDRFVEYQTENPDLTQWINLKLEEVKPYIHEALETSREQRGSALVIYPIESNNNLTIFDPLDINRIKDIDGYNVLSSEELHANEWENDISSKNYGNAKNWKAVESIISAGDAVSRSTIVRNRETYNIFDTSRIIPFYSRKFSNRVKRENNGWGFSAIDRAFFKLANFDQASDTIAASIQNFNQTILFINDLTARIAAGKREQVKEHIRMVAMLQSVLGLLALDANNERYELLSRDYSNLDKMLEHLAQMAAGASDIPLTLLLNRSSSGGATGGGITNDSGKAIERDWSKYVSARQSVDMVPQIRRLIDIWHRCQNNPTGGIPPEKYELKKPAIFQLTEKEEADIKKTEAEINNIYLTQQVIEPLEMAEALSENVPVAAKIDLKRRLTELQSILNQRELENE